MNKTSTFGPREYIARTYQEARTLRALLVAFGDKDIEIVRVAPGQIRVTWVRTEASAKAAVNYGKGGV